MARRIKLPPGYAGFPGLFDDLENGKPRHSSNAESVSDSTPKPTTPAPPQPLQEPGTRTPLISFAPIHNISGGRVPLPGGITPSQQAPLGPVVVSPVPNKIQFMSFGSGSSGNCSYIGDSRGGMLIDAGVDVDTVTEGLKSHGIAMDQIKGICITHDHGDHMRYVYPMVRRFKHMSVYCTPRAMNGIMRRHSVSRRLKDYQVNIYKEIPFEIGNFTVTAFETMHDGSDNAGFFIQHDDRAFTIATDLGCISERVDHYMRQSDYIVIESNYDINMLRFGPYPEYLKARIRAVNGHMDNADTASYLADIYTPRLEWVFLCHLSADNNTPEEAIKASRTALENRGITVGTGGGTPSDTSAHVQLFALPRFGCSPLFTFRPKCKG